MKIIFTLLIASLLSTQTIAQSTTPRNGEMKTYKGKKGKPLKTRTAKTKAVRINGKLTTAGCVQPNGRTVTSGEMGYEQCLRQGGKVK